MKKIILFCLLVGSSSCERLAIEEPDNDPITNFELFWQEFDRYYSFFEQKDIDWDSVYAVYRPQVNTETSSEKLFSVLVEMSLLLEDGHVGINTPRRKRYFDHTQGFPRDAPNFARYIAGHQNVSPKVSYGTVENFGYIRLPSFQGNPEEFSVIHDVLEELRDQDGLIIDIRDHNGGDETYGQLIASRLTDQARHYKYTRFRNGLAHNDFTTWVEFSIYPSGPFQYTKLITVLTNRKIFSAGQDFVLMMRTLPHVTLIGGRSGGGTGKPLHRELPNGWTYVLSSSEIADPITQEIIIDSLGTLPDIEVHITPEDSLAGRDTILERAILELSQ